MTGQHPGQVHCRGNGNENSFALDPEMTTLPRLFKNAGYDEFKEMHSKMLRTRSGWFVRFFGWGQRGETTQYRDGWPVLPGAWKRSLSVRRAGN
jgi:arylsulfatase A-like enzyme